jgi:hypothetical protein
VKAGWRARLVFIFNLQYAQESLRECLSRQILLPPFFSYTPSVGQKPASITSSSPKIFSPNQHSQISRIKKSREQNIHQSKQLNGAGGYLKSIQMIRMDNIDSSSPVGSIRAPSKQAASLDEELARATSILTVGPSPITELSSSFIMPPLHKLHPNLYSNSLKDISMDVKSSSVDALQTDEGVPGFPDFPSSWMGESSYNQKQRNKKSPCKKPKSKQRMIRKAVNTPFGSASVTSTSSKIMKLRARAERKLHRLEKCIKLKEKRRKKKDMRDLCKGITGMCK